MLLLVLLHRPPPPLILVKQVSLTADHSIPSLRATSSEPGLHRATLTGQHYRSKMGASTPRGSTQTKRRLHDGRLRKGRLRREILRKRSFHREILRKKGYETKNYAREANWGVEEQQRAFYKERAPPRRSSPLSPSSPSSATAMLPIPSLWAQAYRYLILYPRGLNFSLLFLYLSHPISRSPRSLYLHLATLRSPTPYRPRVYTPKQARMVKYSLQLQIVNHCQTVFKCSSWQSIGVQAGHG